MSLRLITLGGLRLYRGGEDIALPVQRRTRAALLVYLALERDVARQTVCAVFWPESDEEKARHALSQALHELRRTVGDECLLVEGDRIRCLSAVQVDAADFEAAVAAESYESAFHLYSAAFLEGVDNLPSTKPFESWVDARRAHYERLHRRARRALINASAERGDTAAAIAAARGWAELDPTEDEAQHRLIELLAASGQPLEAVRQYELYERLLGADDLEPLEQTKELVARVRGQALEATPVLATARAVTATAPALTSRRLRRSAAVLLPLLTVLGAIAWVFLHRAPLAADLDADRIVVLPFRALGKDMVARALADGIAVLLPIRLDGEAGLRTVDASTMLAKLDRLLPGGHEDIPEEVARKLAAEVHAGRLARGSVLSTLGRVVVTAELLDTRSGGRRAFVRDDGPADSLTQVLDRVAMRLAGIAAGQPEYRLATLTSTSPAAVSAFLAGEAKMNEAGSATGGRAGLLQGAALDYERALREDTTFVLAAMRLGSARAWSIKTWGLPSPVEVDVCAHRDRLSPRDRRRVDVVLSCAYPGRSASQYISQLDSAATAERDDPEIWYQYADMLFHGGAPAGGPNWRARATAAFERTVELSEVPRGVPLGRAYPWEAVQHLFEMKAESRDGDGLERMAREYRVREVPGPTSLKWLVAAGQGDTASLRALRARGFADLDDDAASDIFRVSLGSALFVHDAELAARSRRPASMRERYWKLRELTSLELNLGRPSAVAADERELGDSLHLPGYLLQKVVLGLYWDGDTAAARQALAELRPLAASRDTSRKSRARRGTAVCALGLWHLSRGELAPMEPYRRMIDGDSAPGTFHYCVRGLRALRASLERDPRIAIVLDTSDAFQVDHWIWWDYITWVPDLISARLHEQRGEFQKALAAIRRRSSPVDGTGLLSTFLRDEGRIAAEAGDSAGAIQAYRRYLTLRYDPEPRLRPQADSVRAALARLELRSRRAQ